MITQPPQAPDVAAVAARYSDRVNIIGVAGQGATEEMRGFVADTGTGNIDHINDQQGEVWSEYGVFVQPAFAFVTADGRVEIFLGSLGEAQLADIVEKLLAA